MIAFHYTDILWHYVQCSAQRHKCFNWQ